MGQVPPRPELSPQEHDAFTSLKRPLPFQGAPRCGKSVSDLWPRTVLQPEPSGLCHLLAGPVTAFLRAQPFCIPPAEAAGLRLAQWHLCGIHWPAESHARPDARRVEQTPPLEEELQSHIAEGRAWVRERDSGGCFYNNCPGMAAFNPHSNPLA